jgi:hypothetical protein
MPASARREAHRPTHFHEANVSAIGLGLWPLVGGLGRIWEKDAVATIRYALDSGITLVDAAQSHEPAALCTKGCFPLARHESDRTAVRSHARSSAALSALQ